MSSSNYRVTIALCHRLKDGPRSKVEAISLKDPKRTVGDNCRRSLHDFGIAVERFGTNIKCRAPCHGSVHASVGSLSLNFIAQVCGGLNSPSISSDRRSGSGEKAPEA